MKLEFFIAKRILFGKGQTKSFTKPVINIAVTGIALGVLIMIMVVSITKGFQKEIKDKISGFASDVQITDSGLSESYESVELPFDSLLYKDLKASEYTEHVHVFASKAGIIKTKDEMQGVILKGISDDFNWHFFKQHIVEGDTLELSGDKIGKDALISKKISKTLNLQLGDKFRVFFIIKKLIDGHEIYDQKKYAFTVKGIYETGLSEEFDAKFLFIDLKRIQKLNRWKDGQIGGYEVFVDNEKGYRSIFSASEGYEHYRDQESEIRGVRYESLSFLDVKSVYSRYPHIISWLNYMDMHIQIVLIIILIVAIVNMSSSLLILILEKTNMIGIMKSLGASNWSIRKMFVIKAAFLITKGTLIGNVLAIIVWYLQSTFKLIPLDASIYYLDAVPIYLNFWHVLEVNILTITVCSVMLILPSVFITYISPVKAIKFS